MPLYKNASTERVTIGGGILEPGSTISTQTYLSPLPVGVTLLADAPMANPILLAQKYTIDTVIPMPLGVTRFQIHFYVESGYPTVRYNSDTNDPALLLYEGAVWNTRCFDRVINDIRLSNMTGCEVWVIIEKL